MGIQKNQIIPVERPVGAAFLHHKKKFKSVIEYVLNYPHELVLSRAVVELRKLQLWHQNARIPVKRRSVGI